MQKTFTISLFLALPLIACAQPVSITARLEVSKTFRFSKAWLVEIGQQLQVTPEIEQKDSPYNNLFNEIYLFPGAEKQSKDTSFTSGLSTESLDILIDWRTATRFRGEYRPLKWLRVAASYSLLVRPKDLPRHGFRADLSFVPISRKHFEWEQRAGLQMVRAIDDGEVEWSRDALFQNGIEWFFKRKHALYMNTSANLELQRDGKPEWDRLRMDVGIRYRFKKLHRFDLGYRFQQRLSGKKAGEQAHGVVLFYEIGF